MDSKYDVSDNPVCKYWMKENRIGIAANDTKFSKAVHTCEREKKKYYRIDVRVYREEV